MFTVISKPTAKEGVQVLNTHLVSTHYHI